MQESEREQQRIGDLVRLIQLAPGGAAALDAGARDGRLTRQLVGRYKRVTALDLQQPDIPDPGVECVRGDITDLPYEDRSFDLVVCTEVLEHIPPSQLRKATSELCRVTRGHMLIGVPYQQDIRVGRTTCPACGARNPPWGHVSSFDEHALDDLFHDMVVEQSSLVGLNGETTNFLSSFLMDLAGNPYGTYGQQEICIYCGSPVIAPPSRTWVQKGLTKLAFWTRYPTARFSRARPNWIHLLLGRAGGMVTHATEPHPPLPHDRSRPKNATLEPTVRKEPLNTRSSPNHSAD